MDPVSFLCLAFSAARDDGEITRETFDALLGVAYS